jgi:tRNA(fMet)-specific endonuclease VapC
VILLDTDHFSVLTDSRHARHWQFASRLTGTDDSVAIPIVAVEEQLRAWLAQIHRVQDVRKQIAPYDRLIRLLETLGDWDVIRWSEKASEEFLRLRQSRVRIGTYDLKIAAIAITENAVLLSANLRDFERVPGLRVEDWLYSK